MKKIINECKLMVCDFNLFSKTVFNYGNYIIFNLILISFIFYIFKGEIAGYYESVEIYTSLLESAKQCVGIIYFTVIISEIIYNKNK